MRNHFRDENPGGCFPRCALFRRIGLLRLSGMLRVRIFFILLCILQVVCALDKNDPRVDSELNSNQ